MTLKKKYQPVLQLVKDYSVFGEEVWEANGTLEIHAVVETTYERDVIWEKIREFGDATPTDLRVALKVRKSDLSHTVKDHKVMRKTAHHYSDQPAR